MSHLLLKKGCLFLMPLTLTMEIFNNDILSGMFQTFNYYIKIKIYVMAEV